jgi:hypothetical protein
VEVVSKNKPSKKVCTNKISSLDLRSMCSNWLNPMMSSGPKLQAWILDLAGRVKYMPLCKRPHVACEAQWQWSWWQAEREGGALLDWEVTAVEVDWEVTPLGLLEGRLNVTALRGKGVGGEGFTWGMLSMNSYQEQL